MLRNCNLMKCSPGHAINVRSWNMEVLSPFKKCPINFLSLINLIKKTSDRERKTSMNCRKRNSTELTRPGGNLCEVYLNLEKIWTKLCIQGFLRDQLLTNSIIASCDSNNKGPEEILCNSGKCQYCINLIQFT